MNTTDYIVLHNYDFYRDRSRDFPRLSWPEVSHLIGQRTIEGRWTGALSMSQQQSESQLREGRKNEYDYTLLKAKNSHLIIAECCSPFFPSSANTSHILATRSGCLSSLERSDPHSVA